MNISSSFSTLLLELVGEAWWSGWSSVFVCCSNLVAAYEKAKKKHQNKLKKLESQMMAMVERHETQVRMLKQRIALLEEETSRPHTNETSLWTSLQIPPHRLSETTHHSQPVGLCSSEDVSQDVHAALLHNSDSPDTKSIISMKRRLRRAPFVFYTVHLFQFIIMRFTVFMLLLVKPVIMMNSRNPHNYS